MAEEKATVRVQHWVNIRNFLSNDKLSNPESFHEIINRVLFESGPAEDLGQAVSESLDKDILKIDIYDVKKGKCDWPVIGWNKNKNPFVIVGKTFRNEFRVILGDQPEGQKNETILSARQLKKEFEAGFSLHDRIEFDAWETLGEKHSRRWFWRAIAPMGKAMRYLSLAAITGNMLALGVSLYALQVWDRVIPARSENSMIVLLIGVFAAIILELVLRLQRAALIDEVGSEIDKDISARAFGQVLGLKSDARPQSLGSTAAQLREIAQIREATSSTILGAAIDLPFSLIFLFVIYMILPQVLLPLVGAIALVCILGLLAQLPLSKLAKAGLEEAAIRNGLIVEVVTKADELKLNNAHKSMLLRWNKVVETANNISNKQKRWRSLLSNVTQAITQSAYILVVSFGALMVLAGEATMGAVIACSILTNRTMAPLMQITSVAASIQGAIMAKSGLDEMMSRPTDIPNKKHLRRDLETPDFHFKNVRYNYPNIEQPSLIIPKLEIPYGAKIGLLGRVGSGKSTLLRLLSGLVEPTQGTVLLGGTEARVIHPDDLRNAIGFQSQAAHLIRGTVRDNLLVARPHATDKELLQACKISTALKLIINNPRGLDLQINESGDGLSGGQRQSLLLARTILRNPTVALFDEPTSSMDPNSELEFIANLKKWGARKTLILATHRTPPLDLCDHLIVLEEGKIALNGPKSEVLQKLNPKAE